MKENFIHVCFVIDQSGSMFSSKEDVIGGFKSIIEEQRKVKDGSCSVSLYTFDDIVKEIYIGKDVNEVKDFEYVPHGCTAMNDGIGMAITNIGKWLNNMDEKDRPSKNLIVIMTDGMENMSKEYTLAQVREMIKHQTDKYNWTFMYVGADITTSSMADDLGIDVRSFSSKKNHFKNYATLNCATTAYRTAAPSACYAVMDSVLTQGCNDITEEYETELGKKID